MHHGVLFSVSQPRPPPYSGGGADLPGDLRGVKVGHQVPPFSVIVRTNARPPRRPRAEAEASLSSSVANAFAAADCWFTALGLSKIRASANARLGKSGHKQLLAEARGGYSTQISQTGGCAMENCTPEWLNMSDIADTIRRSRLVITDAQEVRLTSLECRHRAAVLRGEAQSLRAERRAHSIRG